MVVVRPVTQKGASLGTVYLETLPEPWAQVLGRHSGLAVLTVSGLVFARVERLGWAATLVVVALNVALGVVLVGLKLFVSH